VDPRGRPEPGERRLFQRKRQDFRTLVEFIREDYRTHWRDWTLPGFQAVAVHRFGVWASTIGRPRLLSALVKGIYNLFYRYVRNFYGIELRATTKVGHRLLIPHQGGITIHYLATLGDDCVIHQNVTLGAATVETIDRAPILGDRVEVGCGAAIIGGVVIGNDVRIGPNAVVTMSIPSGSTAVVSPPRVVRLKRQAEPGVPEARECS
jgi:serine O-acetyltransferase